MSPTPVWNEQAVINVDYNMVQNYGEQLLVSVRVWYYKSPTSPHTMVAGTGGFYLHQLMRNENFCMDKYFGLYLSQKDTRVDRGTLRIKYDWILDTGYMAHQVMEKEKIINLKQGEVAIKYFARMKPLLPLTPKDEPVATFLKRMSTEWHAKLDKFVTIEDTAVSEAPVPNSSFVWMIAQVKLMRNATVNTAQGVTLTQDMIDTFQSKLALLEKLEKFDFGKLQSISEQVNQSMHEAIQKAKAEGREEDVEKIKQQAAGTQADILDTVLDQTLDDVATASLRNSKLGKLAADKAESAASEQEVMEDLLTHLRKSESEGDDVAEGSAAEQEEIVLSAKELKQQQQFISQQLKELKKTADEQPFLKAKIEQLSANQDILMAEYNKRQQVIREKKYIQSIPELNACYRRMQQKLTEFLLATKCIASGLVKQSDDIMNKGTHAVSAIASSCIISIAGTALDCAVPGAGLALKCVANAVSLGAKAVEEIHKKRKKAIAQNASVVLDSLTEMEQFTEEFSRRIIFAYEDQIIKMTSGTKLHGMKAALAKVELVSTKSVGGSETFGECVVARLIYAIKTCAVNPELEVPVMDQFMHYLQYESKSSITWFGAQKLHIKGSKDAAWTDLGTLQQTGIKLVDGRAFKGEKSQGAKFCLEPEVYGYRFGSENDVKKFKLVQVEDEEAKTTTTTTTDQAKTEENQEDASKKPISISAKQRMEMIISGNKTLESSIELLRNQLQQERQKRELLEEKVAMLEKLILQK